MQTSMAITAFFMGVVGGPHCVAMCGAACAGIGRAAGARGTRAIAAFQFSRVAGDASEVIGWQAVGSGPAPPPGDELARVDVSLVGPGGGDHGLDLVEVGPPSDGFFEFGDGVVDLAAPL